jgi:HSP20 family molecular chaperone IbpA
MAEKETAITPAREERRLGFGPQQRGASPFTALQRFADEVDRMFDDFGFGRRWTTPFWRHSGAEVWAPDVEVSQKNNELTITADLPGLKKDEVTVDITDDAVTIQGERQRQHREEREGYYHSELRQFLPRGSAARRRDQRRGEGELPRWRARDHDAGAARLKGSPS